jgi:hypothetical protein
MSAMLAKVINSSVGTANFKSLDKLFLDGKSIVATDEEFQSFPPALKTISGLTNNATYNLFTFTLPLDGSCNIRFKAHWSSGDTDTDRITLEAYKNNTLAFSNYVLTANSSNAKEADLYVEGNKGDTFTVKANLSDRGNQTGTIYLYSINASVVDSKTMNITSLR